MLHIVLDTSSFVSYILTRGVIMQQMMAVWEAAEFHLLFSPSTFDELITVLSRPHIQRKANVPINWFLDRVKRYSQFVPGEVKLRGVCRDPKDEIFLACAVEGKAHYLVSSDDDLLDIGRFHETCILNPGQFLVALRLHQMSPAEMKRRYSLEALQVIQRSLCLEQETAAKVAQAVTTFN